MERIICPTKAKMKKQKVKKGQISIRNKKNGKEARVTLQLNIPGMKNPRLEKYEQQKKLQEKD